ncbi:hypothetical protein MKK65_00700 [Methylobacterium sp. J-001]|uniref:hypothetical protein n=1 Tax=Methylobacterium sp. J-001 TaxID=2836609 RepID=UPI001FB944E5|nr:hypothetical protein [Methylobacterium sp. J-001]MCJ2115130.1 hypothetical protein [Methylobacterium sp. J-001]
MQDDAALDIVFSHSQVADKLTPVRRIERQSRAANRRWRTRRTTKDQPDAGPACPIDIAGDRAARSLDRSRGRWLTADDRPRPDTLERPQAEPTIPPH